MLPVYSQEFFLVPYNILNKAYTKKSPMMCLTLIPFMSLLFCSFPFVSAAELIVSEHDLNIAVKFAQDTLSRMQRLENSLKVSDIDVEDSSPSHGQLIDSLPTPEALAHGVNAMIANRASLYLVQQQCRRQHISRGECLDAIKSFSLEATALRHKCAVQFGTFKCRPSFYRMINGACNHLNHLTWGQSYSPYIRLLPASYADGILEPRRSTVKGALPSARMLSNLLVPDMDKPDDESTLALAYWAQFIANDLFQTPIHKMVHTGNSIECCRPDGKPLAPRYIHPHCLQVVIPDDDPDYSPYRTKCMNYVRSLTSLRGQCNFGAADQMNQASHYLDGSMIYGNTASRSIALRAMSGGRLATSEKDTEEFLPLANTPEVHCQIQANDSICYSSGDSRVNQNPHQTAMYTVWVREHNRITEVMQTLNPHWDDNTIFQEARRIVIAQIQHITYKAWVPLILGQSYVQKKGLDVKNKGFGGSYDEDVDPSISNEFSTAGFNFVNSLLQKKLRLCDEDRNTLETIFLQDHFNKPALTQQPGIIDGLLRGLTVQRSQKMDSSIVDDVTSKLFKGAKPFGLDIMSLDIQRGRDHGLPGYNAYRKLCNLPTSTKFDTFLDTIPKSSLSKLKGAYSHPDDVDLVIGALLETPVNDAQVGPTLQCILAEQLLRTRKGDRFFYDLPGLHHSFTEDQINEVKKASLARVLCDNGMGIKSMQIDVFQVPSPSNPLVQCSDSRIPYINLNAWKDTK